MITKSTIQGMTQTVSYQKGVDLQARHPFSELNINTFINEDGDQIREITASVSGSYDNEYNVEIHVNETASEIQQAYCECPAFNNYIGLCKHCTAVLLEYLELRSDGGDVKELPRKREAALKKRNTSKELKSILSRSSLRENAAYLPEAKAGEVHVEPFLIFYQNRFHLRFRLGITQLYVMKNIYKFIVDIQNLSVVSYGKKLEFLHCMDAFDEQSRKLVQFLESCLDSGELQYYKEWGLTPSGTIREIYLKEDQLDAFMLMYVGKTLEVEYQTGLRQENATCVITQESPMQRIQIFGEEDGITLSHSLARGVYGRDYIYYLSKPKNGKIYMVSRKENEGAEDFLEYMFGRRGQNVFIGQEELPAFCKNILPVLERTHRITMTNFLPEQYLPEKVSFEIYLDAPQRDMITCRLLGIYGKRKYNLFSPKDAQKGSQIRDIRREGIVKSSLLQYFQAYDERTETMALQGEDAIYLFLTQGMEPLKSIGDVFVSDKLKNIQVISKVQVQVGVRLSGGLLQMELQSQQFSREQLAEILSRYERKKKYYRLKTGEFIRMDEEGMQVLYDLKENFQLTDRQLKEPQLSLPRYRALYLDSRLKGEGFQISKSREFRQLIRDMKTIEDNDFEIPASLVQVLREYQKNGFLWLKTLCMSQFGGILADDMGLGKTLQTIAFLLSEFQESQEESRRALIVTPASLVYNWKNEFEKFAPELTVHTVTGTVKEREQILHHLESKVVLITSYQLLYRDEEEYDSIGFDYQVIDEAQFIKNQSNQTTHAVKAIPARFRVALTGTPMENRLSELWSIFDFVMPGFLYKYPRFRSEIETPIVRNQNPETMERLQRMIQPFVLRRTKKEVLKELPDKIERCMYTQLEGEQQELYAASVQRLQMQLQNQTEEEFRSSRIQILAEITRLRQICCDPGLLYDQYAGPSAKLDLCMELVESAVESGHKILLFSQFTTMLDKLTQALTEREIRFYLLTGKTPKEQRIHMANRFNEDDTPVFCISLKAGGTGLNLIGADLVIHYDPWWNAAVETQATDRAHRIGQTQAVTVYKLIARSTLEERIVDLQSKKKELAAQILGGEGIGQATFSKEELLKLLEYEDQSRTKSANPQRK